MIADLQCVVLDCAEPLELAGFYRSLLGGAVNQEDRRWAVGEEWATLHTPSGLVLAFQRVRPYQPPRWPDPSRPQQFHLDFGVPDLDQAQERAVASGATPLYDGADERSWSILADPGGAPLLPGPALGTGGREQGRGRYGEPDGAAVPPPVQDE